jgi:exonuclease VII small subunit
MDTTEARLLALEECTEKLEAQLRLHQEGNAAHVDCHDALAQRMGKLETIIAGNERTFAEIISDNAELAQRVAELEDALTAPPAAGE